MGNLALEITSVDLPGNLRYFSNPVGLKSFGTFNIGEGFKINSCEEVFFDSDTFQASGMETHQSDESSIGYKIWKKKAPYVRSRTLNLRSTLFQVFSFRPRTLRRFFFKVPIFIQTYKILCLKVELVIILLELQNMASLISKNFEDKEHQDCFHCVIF